MLTPTQNKNLTPESNIRLDLFLGVVLSAAALFLFYILITGVHTHAPIVQIDQNIDILLHSIVNPQLLNLMIAISLLGLQALWLIVIIVALYFAVRREWIRLGVGLVGTIVIDVTTEILKLFVS